MQITTGILFKLAGEIGAALTSQGVLDAAGNFVNPPSAPAIAKAALEIEIILKSHGVQVDAKLDQVFAALPAVLALFGVK